MCADTSLTLAQVWKTTLLLDFPLRTSPFCQARGPGQETMPPHKQEVERGLSAILTQHPS